MNMIKSEELSNHTGQVPRHPTQPVDIRLAAIGRRGDNRLDSNIAGRGLPKNFTTKVEPMCATYLHSSERKCTLSASPPCTSCTSHPCKVQKQTENCHALEQKCHYPLPHAGPLSAQHGPSLLPIGPVVGLFGSTVGVQRQTPTGEPLHESQRHRWRSEDCLEVTLQVMVNAELESTLLRHGEGMEVVRPVWLRERIASRLRKSLAHYDTTKETK